MINRATVFRGDWKRERLARSPPEAEQRLRRSSGLEGEARQPCASVFAHFLSCFRSAKLSHVPSLELPLQQPFTLGSVINSLLKVPEGGSEGHFINSASLCEA